MAPEERAERDEAQRARRPSHSIQAPREAARQGGVQLDTFQEACARRGREVAPGVLVPGARGRNSLQCGDQRAWVASESAALEIGFQLESAREKAEPQKEREHANSDDGQLGKKAPLGQRIGAEIESDEGDESELPERERMGTTHVAELVGQNRDQLARGKDREDRVGHEHATRARREADDRGVGDRAAGLP